MVTLETAKASRLNRISGVCSTSDDFIQLLNDATRELMRRGNWWNTVRRMTGCIYNDCIVWPREVGSVLAINRCGHSIPPKNYWFEFNDVLPEDVRNHTRFGSQFTNRCWGNIAAVDNGTTAVFNQIPCLNDRFVRFYPTRQEDVGKIVTIFGIDTNGQVIRSQRNDGTYQDGLQMILDIPYIQTVFLVRRIDRVIKDITNGTVFGYQFDGNNLFNMAAYEPSETLPDYRQDRLTGLQQVANLSGSCCGPKQISALVKLQFIPVIRDDDLVLIDNLDALALAIQSIKMSDAYDNEGAETMMTRAVHTLNLDLRDKLPIDQIPVRVHYQGTAHLSRKRVGRVI